MWRCTRVLFSSFLNRYIYLTYIDTYIDTYIIDFWKSFCEDQFQWFSNRLILYVIMKYNEARVLLFLFLIWYMFLFLKKILKWKDFPK